MADDDDDDDDDEDDVDERPQAASAADDVDDEEEEEEDDDDNDDDSSDIEPVGDAEDKKKGTVGGVTTVASQQRVARKREALWLASNFIKVTKSASGANIYKAELLPDKVFFSRDKLKEFVEGKRYKRLLHEMKKGMRTHAENEKLRLKATARRERQLDRRTGKRREKVQRLRAAPDANDHAEIERRKAKFQEKKARRMERKQLAGSS